MRMILDTAHLGEQRFSVRKVVGHLVLLCVLALAVCPAADARTLVPLVPGISVVYAACPLAGTELSDGCTWEGASTVYVSAHGHPVTLYHELGHQFAFRALGDSTSGPLAGAMLKFAHITRQRDAGARWPSDVREQFADAYAACALGEHPAVSEWGGGYFPTGHGYDPTARVQGLVCAMIRRSGARRGWN